MKFVKIGLYAVVALVAVAFLMQIVASETAEVVVLTSEGSDGPEETRLWVVEYDGSQYLRASEDSGWYQRLKATPEVSLARGESSDRYFAQAQSGLGGEINRLMLEKYGWRDVYIEWMIGGRDDAVAVKLVPIT
jgi:hypothetical protein